MKTKAKVFKHLSEVAYTKNGSHRILGFLLGAGVVEKGEVVEFKVADIDETLCNFDYFYDWFENEEEECAVFGSLIEDLSDAQREALADGDVERFERVTEQLMLLLEDYDIDILDEDEEDNEQH